MGIERIGKGGAPNPVVSPPAASGAASPHAPVFEGKLPVAEPVSSLEIEPSALERLRSGALDIKGYLDSKVNDATAHLVHLPAADLSAIRGRLRELLATDPAFTNLVQTATGSVELPSDE